VTGRWTGRGLYLTGHVRSAFSVCVNFSLSIECAALPVMVDRTRPVVQGAYWTPTGRGTVASGQFSSASSHCFVGARLRLDQRVRSVTGPARPVDSGTSGRCFAKEPLRDRHVRSIGLARPVSTTSAGSRS
jgi:hypothetical protein